MAVILWLQKLIANMSFVSLLSIVVLLALLLVILCVFFSSLILYFVIRPLGRDFVQIKLYHIICSSSSVQIDRLTKTNLKNQTAFQS